MIDVSDGRQRTDLPWTDGGAGRLWAAEFDREVVDC